MINYALRRKNRDIAYSDMLNRYDPSEKYV